MAKHHKKAAPISSNKIPRTTLQDLDGEDWGEPSYPSHLVTTVHRLRRVPLQDFTVENLRMVIGQDIGLPYLVPLAVGRLREDPLAAGDFFPGDLLLSVLRRDARFWQTQPKLKQAVEEIAERALAVLADAEVSSSKHVDAESTARDIKGALVQLRESQRRRNAAFKS